MLAARAKHDIRRDQTGVNTWSFHCINEGLLSRFWKFEDCFVF